MGETEQKSEQQKQGVQIRTETKETEETELSNSQTGYTLSLDRFKNAMLASKFKIISHLTGSYVYMNKLAEAMQINRDYKKLVKGAAMIEEERLKKKKAAASGKEQDGEKKKQLEENLKENVVVLEQLRQALIEADERFGDKLRTNQAIRPNTDLADQNTYAVMEALGM